MDDKNLQKGLAVESKKEKYTTFLLNYALYFILGIMILAIILYEPSFLSMNNFWNVVRQASTRGIMALGVAGLIVLQGTDLSAGRVMGLSAALSASLLQSITYSARMYPELGELPLILPFLVALLCGAIFGLINGFGVAVLKIHAFIITLGTQLIAFGLIQIYIESQRFGAQPIGSLDLRYHNFVNGSFLGIPHLVYYLIVVSLVMWVIWNKTTLGKNMFAIGGNPEAAAVSGVSLVKNIMIMYLISGLLYGAAGFLEAGRIGSVNPNTGNTYELDAIAACVVGGVSFSGGVGTIPGVIIGTLILQFINYGLQYVGVNPYLQVIIKGLIIIVAVAIDVRKYIVKK